MLCKTREDHISILIKISNEIISKLLCFSLKSNTITHKIFYELPRPSKHLRIYLPIEYHSSQSAPFKIRQGCKHELLTMPYWAFNTTNSSKNITSPQNKPSAVASSNESKSELRSNLPYTHKYIHQVTTTKSNTCFWFSTQSRSYPHPPLL